MPNASDLYQTAVPDRTSRTDDERIKNIMPLPPPEHLIKFFPIQGTPVEALIANTRKRIHNILHGRDDRLLVIVGPCSIHDPNAAVEYARRLRAERDRHARELEVVMRVYFEKPRTTVGWKGLINDPYLDESYRINEGLRIARDLLVRINNEGVPAGSEFLDVISPQYIGDLISWGAIGARTTESQVHRELASGLKNLLPKDPIWETKLKLSGYHLSIPPSRLCSSTAAMRQRLSASGIWVICQTLDHFRVASKSSLES